MSCDTSAAVTPSLLAPSLLAFCLFFHTPLLIHCFLCRHLSYFDNLNSSKGSVAGGQGGDVFQQGHRERKLETFKIWHFKQWCMIPLTGPPWFPASFCQYATIGAGYKSCSNEDVWKESKAHEGCFCLSEPRHRYKCLPQPWIQEPLVRPLVLLAGALCGCESRPALIRISPSACRGIAALVAGKMWKGECNRSNSLSIQISCLWVSCLCLFWCACCLKTF